MPSSQRVLQSSPVPTSTNPPPAADTPQPLAADSDVVVILAALLCALICVVGLALVARCAWLRRAAVASRSNPPPPPPAKALKKKVIRSLPKTIYDPNLEPCSGGSAADAAANCPICLADFCGGDEVRALPQCGHRFHVACIDTWLAAHSSCPSCRQVLVVARCDRCGAAAAGTKKPTPPGPAEEYSGGNTFLP